MDKKNVTVLVVDDETDFRRLMTFWLDAKGYSVVAASNGASALQYVKEELPDIIFMDLRMPGMDGPETIKAIRQVNNEIPVIVISAHVDDPKAKEVLKLGISGVFYKGMDFEREGLPLLETALRMHKKLKE